MTERKTHTIDASGKALGRIASHAAKILMGKTSPEYTPHIFLGDKVVIENVSKVKITERKSIQKIYTSYTGYPGGLKKVSLQDLNSRKGAGEAIRRAVERMLPRNRLRTARMKNLTIHS